MELTGALGVQTFVRRVTGAPPTARTDRTRVRLPCGPRVTAAYVQASTWVHSYPSSLWEARTGADPARWDGVEADVVEGDLVVAEEDLGVVLRVIPAFLLAVAPWECTALADEWDELAHCQQVLHHLVHGDPAGPRVAVGIVARRGLLGVLTLLLGDNGCIVGWTAQDAGLEHEVPALSALHEQLLQVRDTDALLDTATLRRFGPTLVGGYLWSGSRDPEAYVGMGRRALEQADLELERSLCPEA